MDTRSSEFWHLNKSSVQSNQSPTIEDSDILTSYITNRSKEIDELKKDKESLQLRVEELHLQQTELKERIEKLTKDNDNLKINLDGKIKEYELHKVTSQQKVALLERKHRKRKFDSTDELLVEFRKMNRFIAKFLDNIEDGNKRTKLQELGEISDHEDEQDSADELEQSSLDVEKDDEYSDYEVLRTRLLEANRKLLKPHELSHTSSDIDIIPTPVRPVTRSTSNTKANNGGVSCSRSGSSTVPYRISKQDKHLEQSAFETGPTKIELVSGCGVYIDNVTLKRAEAKCKKSASGLMRSLINVYYTNERLASCSAKKGIDDNIRDSIFDYCLQSYPGNTSKELVRDLTSKCGEERRRLKKNN